MELYPITTRQANFAYAVLTVTGLVGCGICIMVGEGWRSFAPLILFLPWVGVYAYEFYIADMVNPPEKDPNNMSEQERKMLMAKVASERQQQRTIRQLEKKVNKVEEKQEKMSNEGGPT